MVWLALSELLFDKPSGLIMMTSSIATRKKSPKKKSADSNNIARPTKPRGTNRTDSADQLLDATASLLSSRANLEVSFNEIAERSRLNSALIKYYFGSKEGLLMALLERNAEQQMESLRHLVAMDLPATEKLRLHIKGILSAFYASPYLNRLIHHMIEYANSPCSRRVVEVYVEPMIKAYREIVAQGVKEGTFRAVDPAFLYYSLAGSCDYLFSGASMVPKILNVPKINDELQQRYSEHIVDMVLNGLCTRGVRAATGRSHAVTTGHYVRNTGLS